MNRSLPRQVHHLAVTSKRNLLAAAFACGLALFVRPIFAQPAVDQFSLMPKYADEQSQEPTDDADSTDSTALAKKLSNPIANLISVPLQFNLDTGIGPKNADKVTLNIQPVVPVTLNQDWNVIVRTILPVVYQASTANGISSESGLGDTVQSFFFSPTKSSVIWGVGPVFLWPTGTNDLLGSGKWGAGPTAVILKQQGGWTYGALVNHIWSYAGASDRGQVNATFIQPFLTYTWPTATTLAINTESTYDWTTSQWTVPLNLTLAQIVKFGKVPVQFTIGPRYYAQRPLGGPDWGARFVMTFLFPK